MTVFQYLNSIDVFPLIRGGLLSWKAARDRDIYARYLILVKDQRKTNVIYTLANHFNVSVDTVKRARKHMETEIL